MEMKINANKFLLMKYEEIDSADENYTIQINHQSLNLSEHFLQISLKWRKKKKKKKKTDSHRKRLKCERVTIFVISRQTCLRWLQIRYSHNL